MNTVIISAGDKDFELLIYNKNHKYTWNEAIKLNSKIGPKWRLPYDFELEKIFKSPALIGILKNDSYWSKTETADKRARSQAYLNGGDFRKIWYSNPSVIEDKSNFNYLVFVREIKIISSNVYKFIEKHLDTYVGSYNTYKYPKSTYKNAKSKFSNLKLENELIKDALKWKWGYANHSQFPSAQVKLIKKIDSSWKKFIKSNSCKIPFESFMWWESESKKYKSSMYITSAFITHLVHYKKNIPIIDQHNFRAYNYLLNNCRQNHKAKKCPSNWNDIISLQQYVLKIQSAFPNLSLEEIDKFLMELGKELKNNNLYCF
jgi:hypothetical protein